MLLHTPHARRRVASDLPAELVCGGGADARRDGGVGGRVRGAAVGVNVRVGGVVDEVCDEDTKAVGSGEFEVCGGVEGVC